SPFLTGKTTLSKSQSEPYMETAERNAGGSPASPPKTKRNKNGQGNGHSDSHTADLSAILAALQSMQDGDFSVRLPSSWTGLVGKVSDTFNNIAAANQRMAEDLKRVGQVVGKEGRTRERIRFHQTKGAWGDMETSVNTLVEDLLRPTTE